MSRGPVRRPLSRLPLLVLCGATAACASSGPSTAPTRSAPPVPTSTSFDAGFDNQPSSVRDTVLSEPRSRVWSALPAVFQQLGVEASTRDDRSFVIGNEGWRATAIHGTRLSAFLQCGSGITGPNADSYEVMMRLLVQLEAPAPAETLVRIVLYASARPRATSGALLSCASPGTLEGRIVRLIGERLAQPEGAEGGGLGPTSLGGALAIPAGARLPRVGDVLRVGCAAPAEEVRVGEGAFRGVAPGALTLGVGPRRLSVVVPTERVRTIQIRERHTRTRLGAVVGAVAGLAAGAYAGNAAYDPAARNHYGQGTITAIGAVLGGMAGAGLGAIGGWLIREDEWIDVTPAWWQGRAVASPETPAGPGALPAPVCPVLDG